jgi:hypothetical protein
MVEHNGRQSEMMPAGSPAGINLGLPLGGQEF